ncbi:MAG TPA: hypothetical protein VNH11_14365 [Pirellulales bacterium]|nr:hypothetical protein [Pirellulales bacterium]
MKLARLTALSFVILASTGVASAAEPTGPTFGDVSYGPHAADVLDFWKAEGDGPRPLLVYIHGGGWIGGDKKEDPARFRPFLEKGISYAAINYRLMPATAFTIRFTA